MGVRLHGKGNVGAKPKAKVVLEILAITGLEVCMVAFVMSTGAEKPTLARDTMFAVVMLVLTGFQAVSKVLEL